MTLPAEEQVKELDGICAFFQDQLLAAQARIKDLERTAAFVYLWVNREGLTDAERLSVIKHRPGWDRFVNGAEPSDELTEARARIADLEREKADLRTALQQLHDNDMEYIKINNLSGAENNHVLREARKALRL